MKKKKKSIEEQLTKKLIKDLIPKFKQFEKESDPEKRAKDFHEIFPAIYDKMVLEIDNMSDNDFSKLEKSRASELEKTKTDLVNEVFKQRSAEGDLQIKDLGMFTYKPKFENLKK